MSYERRTVKPRPAEVGPVPDPVGFPKRGAPKEFEVVVTGWNPNIQKQQFSLSPGSPVITEVVGARLDCMCLIESMAEMEAIVKYAMAGGKFKLVAVP